MKRLFTILALVLGLASAGLAQTYDYKTSQFIATDFNLWTAVGTTNVVAGAATVTVQQPNVPTVPGGSVFNPFVVGDKLLVDAGTPQETVTITATSCGLNDLVCTFTATFANSHTARYQIKSGTYGLQEALNAAATLSSGGIVVVPPTFAGSTTTITTTTGASTVAISDLRSANNVWYQWSGSANVAVGGTGTDDSQVVTQSHSSKLEIIGVTTVLTATSGDATETWTNAIPAGSVVLGIGAVVTTTFTTTNGTSSIKIGDGSTTNKFSSSTMALTAGTKSTNANWQSSTAAPLYTSATSIVVTANGANFATGAIRLTLYYVKMTGPQD